MTATIAETPPRTSAYSASSAVAVKLTRLAVALKSAVVVKLAAALKLAVALKSKLAVRMTAAP